LGDEFDIFTEPSAEDLAPPQRRYRALGFAVLRFSRRRITETLHLFYTFAVITTLLMIGAGALVTLLLSRKVLAPLHEIVDATREISQGNLDREVPVRTNDEIGTLAEAFNEMTRSLAQSRRELEASLKALAQREKLASLGELTAGIAHELRNPLSTIISSAQIVADPRRSEEQRRRFSGYILDEAKRLSTTLTKFLAFARPNEPHLVSVSPREVLTKAVDLFRQELDEVGIQLETDLPEELPETFRCDPNQLHQVLLNLLINARDAIVSQGEGEEGQITLRARAGKDHLQIEISDTGCGIPPENLKKIFDPFFSTKSDGTGLGLPTVFQIVKS
ncbi:MAG: sensor histidine kinase, partial [Deltaproteobacteria bacterium]